MPSSSPAYRAVYPRLLPPAAAEGITEQPSVAFHQWVNTARPGSCFLDSADRLYMMHRFGHEKVEEPMKTTLIVRERQIIEVVKRNRTVIRWSVSLNLVLLVSLVVSLIV